ncbi:MAG TPA: DUF3108 domain-containing protein [Methylibium sp.]|nr:DUF3108 domain-containing protein [Methylibium sp.]
MLTRRGLLVLALLAVLVAGVHGWLIGRFAPASAEAPAALPALASVAVVSVDAAASTAIAAAAPPPVPQPPAAAVEPAVRPEPPRAAAPPQPARPVAATRAAAASTTEASAEPHPDAAPDAGAREHEPDDAETASAPLQLAAAASPTAAAVAPAPLYRTRPPPSTRLVYRLSRGLIVGAGELDWRQDGVTYQLRLEGKLPLIGTLITQTSRGRFDAAGLAPERHTDRRIRRSEQAVSFQRGAGRVSFSGGAPEQPLLPGLQDRLSVMVQLAAIAAAAPQPPPSGQTVRIAVVGARGDVAVWVLKFEGVQTVATPEGPVSAWHYRREPDSPHDTRAEYWLDPVRGHLPVRVRLTDGSSEPLELLRQSR